MRNILIAAATAAALAVSSAAFADGFYVSPAVGMGGMNTKKPSSTDTLTSYDLRGFAWRLDAGYNVKMNQNLDLGAEVGYTDYANNKYHNTTQNFKYQGHYFDLLGVATYHFTPNWDVFGKLGPAMVYQKTSGNYSTTLVESKTRVKAELAVGGSYNFNKNLGVNLAVYHVFGNNPTVPGTTGETKANLNKTADVNTILLGMQYNF